MYSIAMERWMVVDQELSYVITIHHLSPTLYPDIELSERIAVIIIGLTVLHPGTVPADGGRSGNYLQYHCHY